MYIDDLVQLVISYPIAHWPWSVLIILDWCDLIICQSQDCLMDCLYSNPDLIAFMVIGFNCSFSMLLVIPYIVVIYEVIHSYSICNHNHHCLIMKPSPISFPHFHGKMVYHQSDPGRYIGNIAITCWLHHMYHILHGVSMHKWYILHIHTRIYIYIYIPHIQSPGRTIGHHDLILHTSVIDNTLRSIQNGCHFADHVFILWMKINVFWFKIYCSLFWRVQLILNQHWFRWWLGAQHWQAIIWTNGGSNDGLVYCCIYVSHGHIVLSSVKNDFMQQWGETWRCRCSGGIGQHCSCTYSGVIDTRACAATGLKNFDVCLLCCTAHAWWFMVMIKL